MKIVSNRLKEGEDLKQAIEEMARFNRLPSATILSAVGSLSRLVIRMAGAEADKQNIRTLDGPFEIVSLTGNLGYNRTHLHISVSDVDGRVVGGHLKEGAIVHTTAEIVMISDELTTFGEKPDPETGFGELDIQ